MGESELRRYAREAFRQMDEKASHPTLDEITRLLRGDLATPRRQAVEMHLAECADCRERRNEFEQFLADADSPAAADLTEEYAALQRRIRRGKLVVMAPRWGAIAAAVAVALGLSYTGFRLLRPSPARLLAQAYQEQRAFPFRLADAGYAPMRQERGGGGAFSFPPALLKAQASLAEEAKSSPGDPEVLRLQGEAEMIARQAADAVRTLERARDLRPRDARILSDLGTAYALRAGAERQFEDYSKALEYLSRSLAIQPRALEALFNRALVLESLMLADQAVHAWEEYLKLDGGSEWADEARKHVAELKAKLKAREDVLRKMTGVASDFLAQTAPPADPEAWLDAAIADWLPRAHSDETARKAVDMLGRSFQAHGDTWIAEVAADQVAGIAELAAARAGNRDRHPEAAGQAAREAQQIFLRTGNRAGALRARFEEMSSLRAPATADQCLAAAGKLIQDLDPHPYPWMRAQGRIEYANCAMWKGRLGEAATRLREAIDISQAAGLGDSALRAGIIYLDPLTHVGLRPDLFAKAEECLRAFWSGSYRSYRFYQIVERLQEIAGHSGQPYAAWFLARSEVWASPDALTHAVLAATAEAAGEESEARAHLAISDRMNLESKTVAGPRPQMLLAKVEWTRGDAAAAVTRLAKLRSGVDAGAPSLIKTEYYQALGEAYRRTGSLTESIDAFRKSIDAGAHRAASLTGERERAGVLEAVQESYRGMAAAMLANSASPSDVLHVWKEFAALDSGETSSDRALTTAAPVLSFLELPEEFVAWLTRDDRITLHRFDAPKAAVAAVAARFLHECSDPSGDSRPLREDARQLYRWMVEPFAAQLPDHGAGLVFELDGALTGVPVQALLSGDGGYLSDRFSVRVAAGRANGPASALGPGASALIVADPAVTGASAARFPLLPDSRREADAVRAAFSGSTILEGRDATIQSLAAALPRAAIFHFAGHGYTNSDSGALLFAASGPDKGDYELLRSGELRHQDWSRCRLAVLSACAAAAGETRGAHNPESLVRALAKAGVPQVAASLWNVDSRATSELMAAFYGSLAAGAGASEALRAAQQKVRARPEWTHPYYWAGFQLYGT